MKLKMPEPNGVIIVGSNLDKALHAENKTASLAFEALSEAFAAEELTTLRSTVDKHDVILDKRPKSTSLKLVDEIAKFQVHPTDPNKTASIGAQLDPTLDAPYECSCAKIVTSFPGSLRTCQASHADWPNIAST